MQQIKEVTDYYDKEDQLFSYVADGGGVMGLHYDMGLPKDCLDFVLSQYRRFNVPVTDNLLPAIEAAGSRSFFLADYWNPYILLRGISDVDFTDDWAYHHYEIFDGNEFSGHSAPADPEVLETYSYVPGQAEHFFNHCLSHPGLDGMPYSIGLDIREALFDLDSEIWDSMPEESDRALHELCRTVDQDGNSVFNRRQAEQYLELAAWASFLWLAGPLGMSFRMCHHEIMDCAITYGECILSSGMIYAPTHYRRINRPPRSCYRCGMQTWCVEMTLVDESKDFICEHCLNGDFPSFGGANCGTKFCKQSSCMHHPFAHMHNGAGAVESLRRSGQLTAYARGEGMVKLAKPKSSGYLEPGF